MDPDIVSDETPMPKDVNPDDVAGEVSLQLCEGVGNPDLGGIFVPTLPPFGAGDESADEESVDEFVFGEFEVDGEMDSAATRHMVAFRTVFLRWYQSKNLKSTILTKEHYDRICDFCEQITDGVYFADLVCKGYIQAYKWAKKYDMLSVGGSRILVSKPKYVEAGYDVAHLPKLSYLERLFSDLQSIHYVDHCKGLTIHHRATERHGNIPREVTKIFTDVCPHCISLSNRKKPVAGIRNIVTLGFGQRGQIDLIDFQSMPDGPFNFLLNYIDHGVKVLISIPIVAKRASCVAAALLNIFTLLGPPKILQSDNGGEFSQSAMDHHGKCLYLEDQEIDLIINEIKLLWTECKLVRGSPRHSESNGGVERLNQTVEKKLGAWMIQNKTKNWSVGCKIVQWRYNTQYHSTLKTTPYELVFGIKPLVGLSTLPLSTEILNSLSKENQLNNVFDKMKGSMLQPPKENVKLTEEAQSLVDSISSNLETSRKKRRKASTEDLQASRQAKRSLPSAMATTILHQSPTKSTTPHSPPKLSATSPAKTPQKGKSGGDDLYIDEWTQLLQYRNNPVTLDKMLKSSFHGGKFKFPIIYCINNKDISNPDSWDTAILRKVGRSTFEVLD